MSKNDFLFLARFFARIDGQTFGPATLEAFCKEAKREFPHFDSVRFRLAFGAMCDKRQLTD